LLKLVHLKQNRDKSLTFSKKLGDCHLSLIYNNLFAHQGRTESTIVRRHVLLLSIVDVIVVMLVVCRTFVMTGKMSVRKTPFFPMGSDPVALTLLIEYVQPRGPPKSARKRAKRLYDESFTGRLLSSSLSSLDELPEHVFY
jgi:hypothetical protein